MGLIRKTATARVTLTVEIDVRSTWGDGCDIAQVYRQAEDQARGYLRNAFEKEKRARVSGKPKIVAVISEKDAT